MHITEYPVEFSRGSNGSHIGNYSEKDNYAAQTPAFESRYPRGIESHRPDVLDESYQRVRYIKGSKDAQKYNLN